MQQDLGILYHSSLQILSNPVRLDGACLLACLRLSIESDDDVHFCLLTVSFLMAE